MMIITILIENLGDHKHWLVFFGTLVRSSDHFHRLCKTHNNWVAETLFLDTVFGHFYWVLASSDNMLFGHPEH